MTRHLLEVDFDYEFDLIGISCHLRDYRLCFELNKLLALNLVRGEEGAETDSGIFVVFHDRCEETRTEIRLFVNRSEGGFLIPEKKQADYLLMLRDNARWETDELIGSLKSHPQILTAFEIDPDGLKSKENLLLNDI